MNEKLKIIIRANGLFTFAGTLLTPVYTLFITDLGGKVELAGILFGITFLSSFLADFFITRFTDKRNLNLHLLKFNYFLRACSWLILVLFQSIPIFFIVQILIGISEGVGTPAFNALYSENLDKEQHIRDWGMWDMVKNPLIAFGSIVSGFIVTWYGFHVLFAIMSLSAFITLFYFHKTFR